MPAVEQIARHDRDAEGLRAWLAGLATAVEGAPLDTWTADHERAMAALRVINDMDWQGFDRYRVDAASPELLATGRQLYHDEVRGCVRCHGPHGRGLDGYPRLDRSPWVLGDPQRAAAIVLHGMFGTLRMPDGGVFNSAMEPLGGLLDDQEVAAVLTYVRQSWGNFDTPVIPEQVAAVRAAGHAGMWETAELMGQHPLARDVVVAPPRRGQLRRVLGTAALFVLTLLPAAILIFVLERKSRA